MKKTINHPFHKVSFDYDDKKKWTARDEKLLNLYLSLLDSEEQRYKQASELKKKYIGLASAVGEVRRELKKVRDALTAAREAADHVVAELTLRKKNTLKAFTRKVNKASAAIQDYDQRFRKAEALQAELSKPLDAFQDADEDDSLWQRLSELKITYAYDKRMAIDYVSFDEEEERFRDKIGYINHQNDNTVNYCHSVIDDYMLLRCETEMQYELWAEFGRRLTLIEYVTKMDSGIADLGMN